MSVDLIDKPIYFYVPQAEWGWLSNFAPYGIKGDGQWWPTVEHYFQAAKFFATDPEHAQLIRQVKKPKDAARLGRDRGHVIRPDWDDIKDSIMQQAVLYKFETHPLIGEKLLSTGSAPLVEASPIDYYWGCGQDGSGANRLGKILEETRFILANRAPQRNL